VTFPTWGELMSYHCSKRNVDENGSYKCNPHYEAMACRRYNCSPREDRTEFRFVFLKQVLEESGNQTLVRNGRFIWCSNLRYEGLDECGLRQLSFTVDKGKKRFEISEDNVLCLPSKIYINNNRFFKPKEKTFMGFSSPFAYHKAITAMATGAGVAPATLEQQISDQDPFRPGTLVMPRLGYFYPVNQPNLVTRPDPCSPHPCGIILGKSFHNDGEYGRAFYRVRFGDTTYERVHPVELEIINEV